MALRYAPPEFDSIEILERILDKGMIVDAWLRIGLVGLELSRLESQFVVASLDTYGEGASPRPKRRPLHKAQLRRFPKNGNLLHMSLAPAPPERNSIDVLDRVLDKGIVMEAWLRTGLAGVELSNPDDRLVVSSVGIHVDRCSRKR